MLLAKCQFINWHNPFYVMCSPSDESFPRQLLHRVVIEWLCAWDSYLKLAIMVQLVSSSVVWLAGSGKYWNSWKCVTVFAERIPLLSLIVCWAHVERMLEGKNQACMQVSIHNCWGTTWFDPPHIKAWGMHFFFHTYQRNILVKITSDILSNQMFLLFLHYLSMSVQVITGTFVQVSQFMWSTTMWPNFMFSSA